MKVIWPYIYTSYLNENVIYYPVTNLSAFQNSILTLYVSTNNKSDSQVITVDAHLIQLVKMVSKIPHPPFQTNPEKILLENMS